MLTFCFQESFCSRSQRSFARGRKSHRWTPSLVSLAVSSERLVMLGPGERQLLEIPISSVREITVAPASSQPAAQGNAWEFRIQWDSPESHRASFRYEGFFAEHLARIAERTLRSIWKRELPVLKA